MTSSHASTGRHFVILGSASEFARPDKVRARLAAVLPQATDEVIDGAGHSVAVEHPEEIGRRIDAFVRAHDDPL